VFYTSCHFFLFCRHFLFCQEIFEEILSFELCVVTDMILCVIDLFIIYVLAGVGFLTKNSRERAGRDTKNTEFSATFSLSSHESP
jgi:hypothetical protein